MSVFIAIDEKIVAGFGLLALQQHRELEKSFRILFKLDIFQSNSQRDWLALRWKEACLNESSLFLEKAKELQIIVPFYEESRSKASEFTQKWISAVCEAHERFKQSRT